jgi:hypothetical protein
MRPEVNLKNKIRALERKKALLDALITFLRAHPDIASETVLHQLYNRIGLYFYDTAIVRPIWVKDRVALRLEKYTEDWGDRDADYDPFDTSKRTVCEDISGMSGEELERVLNRLDAELHPDEDDDEENDEG